MPLALASVRPCLISSKVPMGQHYWEKPII